jgi:hypothetical protein
MFSSANFRKVLSETQERREPRRQRVLLSGRLGYLGSNFRCDCTVRNLTDEGAKIVPTTPFLPRPDPFLLVMSRTALYRSTIVWSSGDTFGLRFSDKWDLADSITNSPELFQSWWLDLAKG